MLQAQSVLSKTFARRLFESRIFEASESAFSVGKQVAPTQATNSTHSSD